MQSLYVGKYIYLVLVLISISAIFMAPQPFHVGTYDILICPFHVRLIREELYRRGFWIFAYVDPWLALANSSSFSSDD